MKDRSELKNRQHAMVHVASWGALLCAMILGFQATEGQAYGSVDGEWAAWNVRSIWQWSPFFDTGPLNFFSGMASPYLPNLPWLNPGAAVLSLGLERETTYLISYLIYGLEVGLSVVFLGRILGLSSILSHVVGQLHIVLFFPPFYGVIFGSIPNYVLAPVNAHVMALFNVAAGLFLLVGRLRPMASTAACLAVVAITLTLLISAPFTAMTYIPAYITATAAVLLAKNLARREIWWKVLNSAAVILVLWAIGILEYLRATSLVTARGNISGLQPLQPFNFRSLIASILHVCDQPTSSLLCISDRGLTLTIISLAGASFTFATAKPALRNLAMWFIGFIVLTNIYAGPANFFFNELPNVRAEFLIWSMYTFYGLFIALLPVSIAAFLRDGLPPDFLLWARVQAGSRFAFWLNTFLVPFMAFILIPWQSLHLAWPPIARTGFRYLELPQGPIIRYLSRNMSLKVGGPFRGYTATFFTDPDGQIRRQSNFKHSPASWLFNNLTRQYFYQHYFNTFQEAGLWRFSIPTWEEYGQSVTYQAFFLMSHFLAPAGQIISGQFFLPDVSEDVAILSPQFLRVYDVDIDLLRSLGVRYLITDNSINDARAELVMAEHNNNAVPVYLYEFAGPNLGTYSPLRLVGANTFQATVDAISHNNDRETTVIVDEDSPGSYSSAQMVEIKLERGKLKIVGRSAGKSAVLLPFQFSHCLTAKSIDGREPPRLIRANLVQTLLIFERDISAEITFEFGLFGPKDCRLRDGVEMKEMNTSSNRLSKP
jgi:hypothetical protein